MPKLISREEALKRGLKFYFTGKPCKRGGIAPRRVNCGCTCSACKKFYKDSIAKNQSFCGFRKSGISAKRAKLEAKLKKLINKVFR